MTYERDEYMRRQEAEHAMIAMRAPRQSRHYYWGPRVVSKPATSEVGRSLQHMLAGRPDILSLIGPAEEQVLNNVFIAAEESAALLAALKQASWLLADISPDGLVRKQVDAAIAKAEQT